MYAYESAVSGVEPDMQVVQVFGSRLELDDQPALERSHGQDRRQRGLAEIARYAFGGKQVCLQLEVANCAGARASGDQLLRRGVERALQVLVHLGNPRLDGADEADVESFVRTQSPRPDEPAGVGDRSRRRIEEYSDSAIRHKLVLVPAA